MAVFQGKNFSRLELLRRVGDIRQLAGATPFEFADGRERGTRAVRLYNGGGLDLDVLTDRGMGIAGLRWRGEQLALRTPNGEVHPAYGEPEGVGWLRTWPAGFLTVCGLTQVGSPTQDGAEALGQHGRAAGLAASQVSWGGAWTGDEYDVWVEGLLRESATFGYNLTLRRRLQMRLGDPRFTIEDTITNEGFAPAPLMLLQHFNLGYPLLSEDARLSIPAGTVEPRTAVARAGLAELASFSGPLAGVEEQVFFHDLEPDGAGFVTVSLENPAFGGGRGIKVYWKYRKQDYPILVEWKNMGEGLYALGIEPANCHVDGRVAERERGTLQMLAPQETRRCQIEVGFA